MSKLLNNYKSLKKQNNEILYLFKVGVFYIALENDARFLSKEFNLKLTNLNDVAVKCGFPCTSFDKYYLMLKKINKSFKIIENNQIHEADSFLKNEKINDLINAIKEININELSVSESYAFIEKIQKIANKLNDVM